MNEKNFDTGLMPSDTIEGADEDMNELLVSPEPVSEAVLVDEIVVSEAPLGGIIDDDETPQGDSFPHEAPAGVIAETPVALLGTEDLQRFRTSWTEVQGRFVDEPRSAVQQADSLVKEVIDQLTRMFADERTSLEGQWKQGADVSTEDLRQALLRYHSFFNRLMG